MAPLSPLAHHSFRCVHRVACRVSTSADVVMGSRTTDHLAPGNPLTAAGPCYAWSRFPLTHALLAREVIDADPRVAYPQLPARDCATAEGRSAARDTRRWQSGFDAVGHPVRFHVHDQPISARDAVCN